MCIHVLQVVQNFTTLDWIIQALTVQAGEFNVIAQGDWLRIK